MTKIIFNLKMFLFTAVTCPNNSGMDLILLSWSKMKLRDEELLPRENPDWTERKLVVINPPDQRKLGHAPGSHLTVDWLPPRQPAAPGQINGTCPERSKSEHLHHHHHLILFLSDRTMTAREDLNEEKPKVKMLSPGYGIDKSRLHGSGFRTKGFAITDLLGLESDLQARQQPGGGSGSVAVSGSDPQVPGGLGGFSFPGGSLPLGLGFLCSLAAQQPAGSPCFLPGHLPLLQARTDSHYLQNLEAQRDQYSGTTQSTFSYPPKRLPISEFSNIDMIL